MSSDPITPHPPPPLPALAAPLNTETTGCGHAQPSSRLISEADAQKR